MKKIIFYVNSMRPAGGIERVISTLVNELCKSHHVSILVKDEPYSFYDLDDSVSVESIGTSVSLNMKSRFKRAYSLMCCFLFSVIKLRKYFKDKEYDYVYVATPLSFWECLFASAGRKKLIASEHGARINYNVIYRILKAGYKFSHAYVIPTTDDFNYYLSHGYPARLIPHLRPNLHYVKVDTQSKIVVNIGRFTNDKRQRLLLSIWANILRSGVFFDWSLVLVGIGELENELRSDVEKLGISKNVKILPPQKNIEELYSQASIFALTSSSEGFGMVLLEAISFGIPVVTFNCPSGPKDIIDNGVDGFLISNDDVDSYQHALVTLMSSVELRSNMSKCGFNKASRWNESKIMSQWVRVL